MRKGRIIGVLILVLSMIIGMPVYAEGNNSELKLEVTGPTGMTGTAGTSAKVGDTLKFEINLSGMGGRDDLGGFALRFRVSTKEDGLDSARIGQPTITSTSKCLPGPGNTGIGIATITSSLNENTSTMDDSVKAVVTLPIINDMKGKTLYYKVDFGPIDSEAPRVKETAIGTINVEDDKNPVPTEPQITITADIKADINNLEKGKTFPIELTVTNPNQIDLTYVYVGAGYSEIGMFDENGDDTGVTPDPLGSFKELPAGVTQPDTGEAYMPTLAAGASIKLKLNALIPETYGKDKIVFSFAAMSSEDEQQEKPVAATIIEIKGTIAKAAPDVPVTPDTPDPGTPTPDTPTPGAKPSGQATTGKQTPVVKTTAPKTGDTVPVAGTLVVLLGAVAVMGAAVKKRAAR